MIVGSSNDYCGVYNDGDDADGAPIAVRPDLARLLPLRERRRDFRARSCPGIPATPRPTRPGPQIRTASARRSRPRLGRARPPVRGRRELRRPGRHEEDLRRRLGRDVREPGRRERRDDRTTARNSSAASIVAKGSSAPNLLGKFNDKTAIEADRTSSACDGNVYFAWSRFTGNGGEHIYFSARPTTAPPSRKPASSARASTTSSSRTSPSPATATST